MVSAPGGTEGIESLLDRLHALDRMQRGVEVIVVGKGPESGVVERICARRQYAGVRLVEGGEGADPAGVLLEGAAVAHGEIVVVMNAAPGCSFGQLPALVDPVLEGSQDVVIGGNRKPAMAADQKNPWHRRWRSSVDDWIAGLIHDAGNAPWEAFAFRRELAPTIADRIRGSGVWAGLRRMRRDGLRVMEVAVQPPDALGGAAAMGAKNRTLQAGLVSAVVDILMFQLLFSLENDLALAHIVSFAIAIAAGHAFILRSGGPEAAGWRPAPSLLAARGGILLLRGGILALLVQGMHLPPALAIFPVAGFSLALDRFSVMLHTLVIRGGALPVDARWRIASLGIVGFAILLRLIYLGVTQLIPDEAYYWNYAQHMELSFLDHPPMVAWLIWLGTAFIGDNEFGVRIGAFICGLVAMGYLYALARNLYDRTTGLRTLLLLAVLPLSFVPGMLMTADAPLVAAWAATLYYMERALLGDGGGRAWLGLGIAFGLGILSKYTLGLLGPAALVFVMLDPASRRWLLRPQPYLAAALALLIFSPVIVWNMQHEWSSILFQSGRATGIGNRFSLHLLGLHMLLVLTPVGLAAALLALRAPEQAFADSMAARRRLFVRVFTCVPLAVFFSQSLFGAPKFHWTGPVWLALLPTMAWMMGQTPQLHTLGRRIQAAWRPTVAVLALLYALVLHYVVLGIPGIPYVGFGEHYFWREATQEIERIVQDVHRETGEKPMVVGMSRWSVAASLDFYNQRGRGEPMDIRSRNLFGDNAAMYDFWQPPGPPMHRPVILVGMAPGDLERTREGHEIGLMLEQPNPVLERTILHGDKRLRKLYYRIAQGYRGRPSQPCPEEKC
ncbi:glycosyltransferase family 39 protein [Nitrosovibrio sp. Nv17]|uniref:glycosyltransferase family 39 protein n=1 Tax=Nitrosovibrio sp. Nv17 TaxID=1855339 RepID=UPI0009091DCE|nr:glycosyltransferase family 39 protein [Nitrosovibrio sp. Nv17]SFW13994.1 dolichol-phosphate mannosyltransferase [Nitrosovibrio sp. Nv17]